MAKNKEVAELPKFSFEAICNSKKYKHYKDALTVILDKDKEYTLAEVENELKAFFSKII